MRRLSAFCISLVGAALVSTAASAATIQNVAGIGVFNGTNFITETDFETQISGPSSNFMGVGIVTQINQGASNSYGFGGANPPPYLYSEFSGFTVDTITPSSSGLDIFLKGGQLSYYDFATNQQSNILSQPTAAAAVAAVKAGTLWLSLIPQSINAAGDTVDIHLPSGSLADVSNSSAYSYLDVVTGAGAGPANSVFNTCTITDTSSTGGHCAPTLVDFSFNGGANADSTTTAFQISGTGSVKAFAVPEPLTLSVFGAGLIGLAGLRRRKKAA